ncbi:MAG: trigger factor [Clostridiales bacterium]|nr:trigger factor [Clostridiales bacterium]
MKSTIEKLSSNKVKLHFVVEPELFETGMQAAYKKNVGKINVPGFRRGKAPRKVVEMMYGENIFYEDAIDEIFPKVYSEAVKEHDIMPVDRPEFNLEQIGSGKELIFDIEVFVKPDVELGQYKGVEAVKHTTVVTDDDVNAEIERARERVSRYVDVTDRPVKMDDQVTLNYAGFCEGEQFEGGTAEGHKLVIGSGSFIPGFEDQLVGAEIGKEVEVNVTFPEEYHAENLKGKPATFKCTVTAIQEKDVPALDDEFAKDVSEYDTLDAYKAATKEDLQKKADERDDAEFENAVLDAVCANAKVDIPDAMIEDRIDERIREISMNMRYQGIDMQTYFKYTGTTEENLREQLKDQAKHDVLVRLVLEAVRDAEKVEADEASVNEEIDKYASQASGDAEKFKASLTDDDRKYFEEAVRMRKTVELLKDSAVAKAE